LGWGQQSAEFLRRRRRRRGRRRRGERWEMSE
jgi:hypothetical protein